jgi:hypothetical protein
MKVRTSVRAGRVASNHSQVLLGKGVKGLRVRTSVKAGKLASNHNQSLVRGLKVRTSPEVGQDRRQPQPDSRPGRSVGSIAIRNGRRAPPVRSGTRTSSWARWRPRSR